MTWFATESERASREFTDKQELITSPGEPEWVTTQQATVILGVKTRSRVVQLIHADRIVARRVPRTLRVRINGGRYVSFERTDTWEVTVASLRNYLAEKPEQRRKQAALLRTFHHREGCRCKFCHSEGLICEARTSVTAETFRALQRAAATDKQSLPEALRQAITEYLDTRGLLGDEA